MATLTIATAALGPPATAEAEVDVTVLEHGHAHSDQERPDGRLLTAALEQGFNSVEVDVWLRDGKLIVGHDEPPPTETRTLESHYLAPLKNAVAGNGGQVYRGSQKPFNLVVEIKNPAAEVMQAYQQLENDLKARYIPMLHRWAGGRTVPGPVRVVLTGAAPRAHIASLPTRFVFFDGGDPADFTGALMPVVNRRWDNVTSWNGRDLLTRAVLDELSGAAVAAHRQGRELRLWGTPQTAASWLASLQAGVDYLEADDVVALGRLLREHGDGKAFRTSTRGSASTVSTGYDLTGHPVASGTLTDIEADGACASVTVNFEQWSGTQEPATTKSTCDNTSATWSVRPPARAALYRYVRITVSGSVVPPVTTHYAVTNVLSTKVGEPGWMPGVQRLGGAIIGGAGASRVEQGWLRTYVRGTNDVVYETEHHPHSGGWSGAFKPLPGAKTTSDTAAVFEGDPEGVDSRQHIFFRGANGALWHKYQDEGFVWRDQDLGGQIIGSPAAVSLGSGSLDVFARGRDNKLYQRSFRNGTWLAYVRRGEETFTSDPAAVAPAAGRIDVFLRGNDGQIYQKTHTTPGGWPATFQRLPGVVTGGPAVAAAWRQGRLDLFARSAGNNLVWRTYTVAGGWTANYVNLGGTFTSDPEAVSWGPGRIDVLGRGGDGALWHRSYREAFGPTEIRALQFNVQGFVANAGSTDAVAKLAEKIVAVIRDRKADVVSLNELCSAHFNRIFTALVATGEYVVNHSLEYFPRLEDKPACGRGFGNAVLAKASTLGGPEHLGLIQTLTVPPGVVEPRSMVCISQPRRTALFCSAHLQPSDTPAAVAARRASISTINNVLDKYAKAGWQVVFMGDVNARPGDDEMDALYEPRYGQGASGDFREAVRFRGGDGTTDPGNKFDYILVNRHVTDVSPPRVTEVNYSDHHSYEATITLK